MSKYSQIKAMFAVTKASLISMVKNPSSIVFSIIFPVIFIAIFGLFGNGGGNYDLYFDPSSDKSAPLYDVLDKMDVFSKSEYETYDEAYKDLQKGRVDAIIKVVNSKGTSEIELITSEAAIVNGSVIESILKGIVNEINIKSNTIIEVASLQVEKISGREFKQIDFILPGQLGFALLNTGIFGSAFALLSLRDTLVLKRFFATPVNRLFILMGEGLSRLIFSTLQAVLIIAIGHFVFHFTLINGVWTALQMILIAMCGLIVFLGMGLMISSIAKDENSIAPLANLLTLPQFLLGGVFFPIEVFPSWLQPIAQVLPLTHLNEAMRKVAFEGADFSAIAMNLLVLLTWAAVVYALTSRLFKWDK